jgi:hypothetical protein
MLFAALFLFHLVGLADAQGSTIWSGTYRIEAGCNQASCCCLSGSFSVSQTGTTVSATSVPVSGVCGGATTTSFSMNLGSATSASGSTTLGGQTVNIAKNGVSVTLTNTAASQCSGSAICTSGDCLSPFGSYYSVHYDTVAGACRPGCEMNAPASAVLSLSTGVLTVGFQGGLGGTCNGSPISRSVSGLQITNVFALSGVTGFYQGVRGGATFCFYLDSRMLALPQQPGVCPDGPPFRPSCAGAGLRTDVLVFGNPTPSTIPVSLPASAMTTTMVIPTAVGGSCAGNCVLNQTFTITRTATNALSLTAGAVVNNACNVGAWSSFTLTNIVTRESPGYFFGTSSATGGTVCFIYISGVFVFGGSSCPTGPLRSYCGTGASAGSIVTYAMAQTEPLPVGPPLQQTGGGSGGSATTTPAAGTATTVWSGNYQTNSGCNSATCCCPSGSFTLTQTDVTVRGTMSLTGQQCMGSTLLPFFVHIVKSNCNLGEFAMVERQPLTLVKTGTTVTMTNGGASQCSTSFTCTSGDCARSAGGAVCFHESTLITYRGTVRTLRDFTQGHDSEECHVPHIVRSSQGVRIEAHCAASRQNKVLRLTGDHLVFTLAGLKAAASVVVGDTVFADLSETERCSVVHVASEDAHHEQTYFGLNCLESVVLADGIKTSTFGQYHWFPAAWMKYASKVLGVKRASSVGDSIVQWLNKMKFL